MTDFTPGSALIGGAMIGAAAVLLLKFIGRIAGISGILHGAVSNRSEGRSWRLAFLAGLVIGGVTYRLITGDALVTRESVSYVQLIVAGLLVGFGTRLGSGCTSGHGVCGIARLSLRSVVATLVFLAVGMLTASAVHLSRIGA